MMTTTMLMRLLGVRFAKKRLNRWISRGCERGFHLCWLNGTAAAAGRDKQREEGQPGVPPGAPAIECALVQTLQITIQSILPPGLPARCRR